VSLSATHWSVIEAARAGEEGAVRALCEKYRPAIVAYLERRGLGAEAEDVAQEALLALVGTALARAASGQGRFRGLVFAIARNQLGKHVERQRAAKRGGGQVEHLGEREAAVAAEEPDDLFDREWLGALVRAALARLEREHPPYFEALRAFLLDERPQAEIAGRLGVAVGVVKQRVHRGKRKVIGYLREEVWSYASSPGEYEAELQALARLLEP
jgi:RNA polymerase sigma-70 factor (ECF subfamily)